MIVRVPMGSTLADDPFSLCHFELKVLVLPECGFESWPGRSRRLCHWARHFNHNCFVLRMGRKAVGPVYCVMHVKEPRTLIVKEEGVLPRCFWIRALSTQQGGYVHATNILYYYYYLYFPLFVKDVSPVFYHQFQEICICFGTKTKTNTSKWDISQK